MLSKLRNTRKAGPVLQVVHRVYRRTDGESVFVQADSPTDEDLQALLYKIITGLMKLLTRRGVLVEEEEEEEESASTS